MWHSKELHFNFSTIIGILIFISRINFMFRWVAHNIFLKHPAWFCDVVLCELSSLLFLLCFFPNQSGVCVCVCVCASVCACLYHLLYFYCILAFPKKPEIFARVLFSLNFADAKIHEKKPWAMAKSVYHLTHSYVELPLDAASLSRPIACQLHTFTSN